MVQEIPVTDIENKPLAGNGIVSNAFLAKEINDLRSAFQFVKQLSYRRNGDKAATCAVMDEGSGTCSTKHALLYRLAEEQQLPGFELVMGIFRMGTGYNLKLKELLQQHGLPYMPEAHCYLKYNGAILDCTSERSSAADFIYELIEEHIITPQQTTDFKVTVHKRYLQHCIDTEPVFQGFDAGRLWAIREACIALHG